MKTFLSQNLNKKTNGYRDIPIGNELGSYATYTSKNEQENEWIYSLQNQNAKKKKVRIKSKEFPFQELG